MMAAGSISLLLALLVLCTDSYPTTPDAEHPGVCPELREWELGNCAIRCKSDSDCLNYMKCCGTGCDGSLCKLPNDKPGLCPEAIQAESCPSANQCKSDNQCQGTLKCCQSGCSQLSCQSPTGSKQL
ncbi:WAP four-disulfide core domain protein 2 isoform X2 [Microcaecilia unicolor]|uniref:WAP four-disulfide core domain protein 2-like isoform X2 n=1 Tax=Microcaecilia unicolor TaxID=1415580 RepID=A0A6P7YFR5_9AMPH|nr:WAP four-disulfide core domain protein 2-like isoform X2 [Microcaecilia unicolor]